MLDDFIKGVTEEKWADHPRIKTSRGESVPEAGKVTPEMLERRGFRMNKPFIPSGIYYNNNTTSRLITYIDFNTDLIVYDLKVFHYKPAEKRTKELNPTKITLYFI